MLHTDIKKKNTRWRRSVRTEERRASIIRLVQKNVKLQIICLRAHHNRFNKPQKAALVLKCGGCESHLLNTVVFIFRFLASGNSQISMNFSYRIAPSTVRSIIISTCEAIWNKLPPTVLPQPTEEEWNKKEEEF